MNLSNLTPIIRKYLSVINRYDHCGVDIEYIHEINLCYVKIYVSNTEQKNYYCGWNNEKQYSKIDDISRKLRKMFPMSFCVICDVK